MEHNLPIILFMFFSKLLLISQVIKIFWIISKRVYFYLSFLGYLYHLCHDFSVIKISLKAQLKKFRFLFGSQFVVTTIMGNSRVTIESSWSYCSCNQEEGRNDNFAQLILFTVFNNDAIHSGLLNISSYKIKNKFYNWNI